MKFTITVYQQPQLFRNFLISAPEKLINELSDSLFASFVASCQEHWPTDLLLRISEDKIILLIQLGFFTEKHWRFLVDLDTAIHPCDKHEFNYIDLDVIFQTVIGNSEHLEFDLLRYPTLIQNHHVLSLLFNFCYVYDPIHKDRVHQLVYTYSRVPLVAKL